jgi:outer membrane protein TolC
LTGGYGGLLSQLFAYRYPTYEVGIQLNLPIRNRTAQADVVRDELQLRTYQTRYLQLQRQAALEIEDAVIALWRSRVAHQAAARARRLQAQSLEVEQAKLGAGVSTAFFVIQYQSYLSQARSSEVVAKSNYFKARAALDRALGASLEVNKISFDEAYRGQLSRPPAPLPAPNPERR